MPFTAWKHTERNRYKDRKNNNIFFAFRGLSDFNKGPFKYYVSKEVGGWGGQLLTSADKVGGWGWPNTDVSKKKKKSIQQKSFLF